MKENKLLIAAAGAGKTTFLVRNALDIIENNGNAKIILITFTRSNAEQIRNTIRSENIKRGGFGIIPDNIVVQEWFTFLLREGVRPYKSIMHPDLKYKHIGFYPDFQYRNNIYTQESKILEHYFLNYKAISNAISKFVIKVNDKSGGNIFDRLQNIYTHIFIDEVQDLVGYDLELIKNLFMSKSTIILVGDPRQVTYSTHYEKINSKYSDGKIKDYILEKCQKLNVVIDENTLKYSHRNNKSLCDFSSNLYPNFENTEPCECTVCKRAKEHVGVFLVRTKDVEYYKSQFGNTNFCILRWQKSIYPEKNFGDSKGLTFDRVLIYPTGTIIEYLKNGKLTKLVKNKRNKIEEKRAFDIAKFYVAVTRARHSIGIVYDYRENDIFIDGIQKFIPN